MEWNKSRQLNELPKISRAISPEDTRGVTAIEDLVNQAVDMFQSIEDRAAETNARALDLAQRATNQLKLTERRNVITKRFASLLEQRARVVFVSPKQSKWLWSLKSRLLALKIDYPLPKPVPEMQKHAQSRQRRPSFESKIRFEISCL